jgi:hypothetical protein
VYLMLEPLVSVVFVVVMKLSITRTRAVSTARFAVRVDSQPESSLG